MSANVMPALVLRHPTLTHDDLARLLTKLVPNGAPSWALATQLTMTCFTRFAESTAGTLVRHWTAGRVFCQTIEIRWQRAPGGEHNDVVVLTEDTSLTLEGFNPIGRRWYAVPPGEQAALKAWGSSVRQSAEAAVWTETRLPKYLIYPPDCKQGRLHCLYYSGPSGAIRFVRLVAVK